MIDGTDFVRYATVLAVLWMFAWLIVAVRDIAMGRAHSVSFVMLVIFLFLGLPVLLDWTFGKPVYTLWPRYRFVTTDLWTDAGYALYLFLIPPVIWAVGRSSTASPLGQVGLEMAPQRHANWINGIATALLILPLALWAFAPDPSIYLTYNPLLRHPMTSAQLAYHTYITTACLLTLLAGPVAMAIQGITTLTVLLAIPATLAAGWLQGKRSGIALVILFSLLVAWCRPSRGRSYAWAASLAGVALLGLFSYGYQTSLRGFEDMTGIQQYENLRVDYGRDHGVKLAIYAELHPGEFQILEHRWQGLLFDLAMFVPRSVWREKPWSYATYSTAAALGLPPRDLGWGMTTSWLEEAIATFGWAGLFLGPGVIAAMCRIGDGCRNPLHSMLTIVVACMMVAVQLQPFYLLAALWLALTVYLRRGQPTY